MSHNKQIIYKYGATGFVELEDNVAKKNIDFSLTYWIKEYSILLFLWPFKTDNIIKYESGTFVYKTNPTTNNKNLYYEMVFERYPFTLSDYKIYRDQTIIQVMLDCSSAITFLHSLKIWHRDIKPQNILVSKTGRAVLIDFSHSHRFIIDLPSIDSNIATLYYRAPELFDNSENIIVYNEKIDVWALGIIFVEIITGLVFMTEISDGTEINVKNIVCDKNRFNNLLKSFYWNNKRTFIYAREYWELILKMTEHDPNNRISMNIVVDELTNLAKHKDISFIEPINTIKHAKRWIIPDIKIDDSYNDILSLCKNKFDYFKISYNFKTEYNRIVSIIKNLIKKEIINTVNYYIYVLGIMIIVETILYDILFDISDVDNSDMASVDINNVIMNIIQNFDQDLFANGVYDYLNLL